MKASAFSVLTRLAVPAVIGTAVVASVVPLAGQASSKGQWSAPFSLPLVAVHAALMPGGEVLMFDAWEIPGTPSARLWNPATNTFVSVPNSFAELFCAGHVLLGDGRLITIGGHNGSGVGTTDATMFNPATRLWTQLPNLGYARWYPGAAQLADGRVLTLGGSISRPEVAEIPEIYRPGDASWTPLNAAQKDVGEYPRMFPLPNGKVFVADAAAALQSWILDVDARIWTPVGASPAPTGDAVMYEPGRIMMSGGGTGASSPVTANTAVIDLNGQNAAWQSTQSMSYGRFLHNLVILPDGKVLAVGGSTEVSLISRSGVLPAEMWDPASKTWTEMAAMATPRMYHSTALLLPDGRVVSAGGGRLAPAIDHLDAEFYSPPYLFQGPRPTITSVSSSSTTYGATLTVGTPNDSTTARVTMVRASSVTHASNYDQRFLELSFTPGVGQLAVQMPSGANVAPPGYYMLFILDTNGVPSVGRMVRLDATTSAGPGVSVNDVSVVEGTGSSSAAVFSVTLSAPSALAVTVDYTTNDATATAGSDYTAASGTLTFPAGTTVQTVSIPVAADTIIEPNETFTIALSTPTNAVVADGLGQATIVNDDLPAVPSVSINDVRVTEGTGAGTPVATFIVTSSFASAQDVLVSFRTVAGTAATPADFLSTSGVLTFAGGTTSQTIQVPIVPDAVGEPDETFQVELSNPVNAIIGDGIGIGTIVNDDTITATFQISAGGDDVNESGTTLDAQSSSIWLGNGSSPTASYAGLRFVGVSIPRGAVVSSARLEVNAASTQWVRLNFEYGAEASANSLPFTTTTRPSQRTLLAPKVTHASDAQWVSNTWYPLDQIAPLVQAAVGQSSWAAGNALSLVLRGTGTAWSRKFARSVEADPTRAPRLVVSYSGGEAAAPSVTFTSSPTTIIRGTSATLTWNASNATAATIDQGIGTVAVPSGSVIVSPTTTTAYTLSATNVNGSTSASTIVTVNPPAPTATFTVTPAAVTAGSAATLTWTTSDAATVAIDQGIGSVAQSGSVPVTPSTTTTYRLTATNVTGTVTATTTLTVSPVAPPMPTATLSIAPTAVTAGTPAQLMWSTTDATTVTIDQGIGPVTAAGSISVTPTATTTYRVTATNITGTATATATVTVTVPAPTASLTVTPSTVVAGTAAGLSWSTTFASSVTIDQGIGSVATSGTQNVAPMATTTYTLTAVNGTGTVTATATLVVTPPPLPTAALSVSPTSIAAGQSAMLTWSTTSASTISIDQGIGPVGASGTRVVNPTVTTTYGLTASNLTGSVTSTTTLTVTAPVPGASLSFNGTSMRARSTVLPALTVFTAEAWVKRNADRGRYETFVSNASTGYSRETIGLYVDGGNGDCGANPPDQFAFAYTKTTGGWFFICSGISANLNVWHHIAVTRDSANAVRIFVDGVLRNTAANTAPPTTSTGVFGIGSAADALTEFFPGLLDEVRISSVVRYTTNFSVQTAPFTTDANTVALYHLDEGAGQTIADSSGNNRNGVLGTTTAVETIDPAWSTDAPIH